MIHPHTRVTYINDQVGYGVVATEFIPRGTITWVLDDLDAVIAPDRVNLLRAPLKEMVEMLAYRNHRGEYILCWDHGKYVNHSFRSSCFSTSYDFEVAIRDIHPGEELTDDYGYCNLTRPMRGIDEGTRRKVVYPDDCLKYYKTWDKMILKSFMRIPLCSQPLQEIIPSDIWTQVEKVLHGTDTMESILSCYYNDKIVEKGYA